MIKRWHRLQYSVFFTIPYRHLTSKWIVMWVWMTIRLKSVIKYWHSSIHILSEEGDDCRVMSAIKKIPFPFLIFDFSKRCRISDASQNAVWSMFMSMKINILHIYFIEGIYTFLYIYFSTHGRAQRGIIYTLKVMYFQLGVLLPVKMILLLMLHTARLQRLIDNHKLELSFRDLYPRGAQYIMDKTDFLRWNQKLSNQMII